MISTRNHGNSRGLHVSKRHHPTNWFVGVVLGSIFIGGILCGQPTISRAVGSCPSGAVDGNRFVLSAVLPSWNCTWGDSGDEEGLSVTDDGNGHVYMAGSTFHSMGGYDAIIVKYADNGTELWNRTLGGGCCEIGYGVALDGNGDVFVAGCTSSSGAGAFDALIAKFSPDGTQLWNSTWGGIGSEEGAGIAIDKDGNALITGWTNSSGTGDYDAFVTTFAGNGTYIGNHTWGGSGDEYGSGLVLDGAGDVCITGYTTSFGAGNFDAFLVKFAANGTQIYNRTWGHTYDDYGQGIAVDGSDNIFIVGSTDSGGGRAFITKYAANGTMLWGELYNPPVSLGAYTVSFDVAVDATGRAFLAGTIDLTGTGNADAFVAEYSLSGVVEWSGIYNTTSSDFGSGIDLDAAGNVYLAGITHATSAGDSDAFLVKNPTELIVEGDPDVPGYAPVLTAGITIVAFVILARTRVRHKIVVKE